VSRGFEVGSK